MRRLWTRWPPRHIANLLVLLVFSLGPAGSASDDLLLHPLCLDHLGLHHFDAPGEPDQALICTSPFDAEITTTPAGWVFAERPVGPEGYFEGWVSYRVAGTFPQLWDDGMFYLLEVVSNTGGTGQFSSLWVLEQISQRPVFWPWLDIGGGDRCNDGQLRGIELTPETLVYAHAATPFRLMNPRDHTNWRFEHYTHALSAPDETGPSTFMSWRPYDDVPHCAICCAGEIVNEVDLDTGDIRVGGVYLDPGRWTEELRDTPGFEDCSTQWLDGLGIANDAGPVYIALHAWEARLEDLGSSCAGAR
jgi:hypothetical protein